MRSNRKGQMEREEEKKMTTSLTSKSREKEICTNRMKLKEQKNERKRKEINE